MLVDVHSHFFRDPDHFSEDFRRQLRRARNQDLNMTVRWEEYRTSSEMCEKSIVFGGKARLSGLWVPDQEVAAYVAQDQSRLLGFLSVNPTQAGWREELREGYQDLQIEGNQVVDNVCRLQAEPA